MIVRLLCCTIAIALITGSVSAQDEFSGFDSFSKVLNSETDFGPALEGSENPTVEVTSELVQIDSKTVELRISATPPAGFYLHSTTTEAGQKTRFSFDQTADLTPSQQGFRPDHPPKSIYSDVFEGHVEKYFDTVTWSRRFTSAEPLHGTIRMSGSLKGQICTADETATDQICILLHPAPTFTAEIVADETMVTAEPGSPAGIPDYPSAVAVLQENVTPQEAKIGYTVRLSPADAQPGDTVILAVTTDIAPGWHTYSTTISNDLGVPTEIALTEVAGLEQLGELKTPTAPTQKPGALEGEILEVYEGRVTWSMPFRVTDDQAHIVGTIAGQVCSDKICLKPETANFAVSLSGDVQVETFAFASSDGSPASTENGPDEVEETPSTASEGLALFLLGAMSAGLVSLLTPCVFPMIPVTVAFFLKQGESGKGNTKLLAVVYCLAIIASFTVIGVVASIFFGPQAMTAWANGAWLNLVFAIVFVAFALMLMGVFEVRVPAFLLNWSSKREGQGGLVGVLFMAITFTLVSFTCTGAFVATILAVASQGDYLRPVLGMLVFSTTFACPFFFLALFPGLLARMPKSGGWMQKVKCTAGLVELALAVKFLSVADIGFSSDAMPRFIDFTTAMVMWTALAFVTGLYLLGVFRFSKDTPTDGVSPISGLIGIGSIGLALLICVGLFSPVQQNNWMWNRLVGFAPPRFGEVADAPIKDQFSDLNNARYAWAHEGLAWSLELETALELAQERNRPVFIDFTGVNCVNCRDMENSVLNQREVLQVLATMPRAQLFLDLVPTVRDPKEKERLLDENLELSLKLTRGTAMPSYVVLAPNGRDVLASTSGLVSMEAFQAFLDEGLQKFDAVAETQSDGSAQRVVHR